MMQSLTLTYFYLYRFWLYINKISMHYLLLVLESSCRGSSLSKTAAQVLHSELHFEGSAQHGSFFLSETGNKFVVYLNYCILISTVCRKSKPIYLEKRSLLLLGLFLCAFMHYLWVLLLLPVLVLTSVTKICLELDKCYRNLQTAINGCTLINNCCLTLNKTHKWF